ncbi:MAG: AAA family ATPase [Deltaproteobacteria bacterium]|nr:AAA family ATPase [Deltaproteobacteria bacterium]
MSGQHGLVGHRPLLENAPPIPPFIGRKTELEQLEQYFQAALTGRPQVVLLRGEAGIGKTRLLKEALSIAAALGFETCQGRCLEDVALPYLPFVQSLLTRLGTFADAESLLLSEDLTTIKRLLFSPPTLTDAPSVASSERVDEEKRRLFLAVSRAVLQFVQGHPLLVAIDDLHWADQPSLDLLSHLVFTLTDGAEQSPTPLVLVGAHRPVEPEERLARTIDRFQRESVCQLLALGGLSELEVSELVRGLGLKALSYQFVWTVNTTARGNPLFVQEIVQQFDGVTLPAAPQLPTQITVSITNRLKGLKEDCREVCVLASFLGESFSLETLAAVSHRDELALLELLQDGIRQRVLVNDGPVFQFVHPLVRHVLYQEQGALLRQRRHWQIARELEQMYTHQPEAHIEEIAHHLVNAGPVAEATKVASYARRAGERAFAAADWGQAAAYYETALAATERAGDLTPQLQGELHYLAGYSHYRNMDAQPSLEHYDKAVAAYRQTDDLCGLALALKEYIGSRFTLAAVPFGSFIDVQPLLEVVAALGECERSLQGQLWSKISQAYWHSRQIDNAEAAARTALELSHRAHNDALCAEACVALALAQTQSLHVQEALDSWQQSLVAARRVHDPWRQGWSLQRAPALLTTLGRFEEAEAHAQEAITLVQQTHDWGGDGLALGSLALVALARGEFGVVERLAQEAMVRVRRSRYPWGGSIALQSLASARLLRGAWEESEDALVLLTEPGRVFADPGPLFHAGVRVYHQLLWAHSGKAGEVGAQLELNPPRPARPDFIDIDALARYCSFVEIARLIERPELAGQYEEPLVFALERGVLFARSWGFLLPRILGVVATLSRNWELAESRFASAQQAAKQAGARPEFARSLLDAAWMLIERGRRSDRQEAGDLLKHGHHICVELGMEPFARWAAQAAATLGVPVSARLASHVAAAGQLTEREREVARFTARHQTDQDIAESLLLTPQTVKRLLESLASKTGVREREAPVETSRRRTASFRQEPQRLPVSQKKPDSMFRREGEAWELAYQGERCSLKDAKGLHLLAYLLRFPHQEFPAPQLAGVGKKPAASGTLPQPNLSVAEAVASGLGIRGLGNAGERLDRQAQAEYKRRLAELREEQDEAEALNDLGRLEKVREEMEFLADELRAAHGLAGRDRRDADVEELARLSVTKAIKAALQKIAEHLPPLGRHLLVSVKTGKVCSYMPDPTRPLVWELDS